MPVTYARHVSRCALHLAIMTLGLVLGCHRTPEDSLNLRAESRHEGGAPVALTAVELPAEFEADGRVGIEPARIGSVEEGVGAPCEVVPAPEGIAAVATTVSARIVRWHVTAGQGVRAQQAIVTLDSREVAEQRASAARARIDADEIAARVAEEERLLPQGATSGRAAREARAALERARASLDAARRVLASAQAPEGGAAGLFTLRAPIAGTVVVREGLEGAVASAGATLVSIVDMARVRIAAHLPEEASDVPEGARATLTLRGRPGILGARVVWRSPTLDRDARTRTVLLAPDEPQGLILEQTGSVLLDRDTSTRAVLVPASALHREGSRVFVFVRRAAGRYDARAVTLGRDEGSLVEVVSGLEAAEPVVVRGTFLVASEFIRSRAAAQGP